MVVSVGMLLAGLFRLRLIASHARVLEDGLWAELVQATTNELTIGSRVSVLLAVGIAGYSVSAQAESAALTGFVYDSSGAGISNATLTLSPAGPRIPSVASKPVNLRFSSAGVKQVMTFIAGGSNLRVRFDPAVQDHSVTFRVQDTSLQEAVEVVLAKANLVFTIADDQALVVSPAAPRTHQTVRTDGAG